MSRQKGQSRRKALMAKLQKAIELELATIPPYLTALYSIKPSKNVASYKIIKSVVLEEMLHMLLAANTLSALGGVVQLGRRNIPKYPLQLTFKRDPFTDRQFPIELQRLSEDAVSLFLKIELPGFLEDSFTTLNAMEIPGLTIGEFYQSIKDDLRELTELLGEEEVFCGNPANQISEQYYWGAGGKAVVVTNLSSALDAIDIIIDQGEGLLDVSAEPDFFKQENEVPHYFRFLEIFSERYFLPTDSPYSEPSGGPLLVNYNDVYPLKSNCRHQDFLGQPELEHLNNLFNANYSTMLQQIQEGFSGNPRAFYTAIVNGMHNLTPIAMNMVQIPLTKYENKVNASPSFEWR